MKIDVSALEKAVGRLEESLKYLSSNMAKKDESLKAQFRGASIQAFEYTYELTVKMIYRQLEQIVPNPDELKGMPFMDVMRTAAQAGLVRDAGKFKEYREKRSRTAHTYDEETAEDVAANLDGFLQDARFILNELKRRNA
jgi:nucleotidyltransferase substrate binding protein (TIGR01987 family)